MQEEILILDDDLAILNGFKELLSENGYFIDISQSEKEAFRKIKKKNYALVIVDMMLKDKNGLDFIRKIKSLQPNIVVVVLTAHSPENYLLDCIYAGATAFLSKPCAIEDMLSAIGNGLDYRRNNFGCKVAHVSSYVEEMIMHNPNCIDMILKYSKRRVSRETLKNLKRCNRKLACLFSDDPKFCKVTSYVGPNTCSIDRPLNKICKSENQFPFGSDYFCCCPVRAELCRNYSL